MTNLVVLSKRSFLVFIATLLWLTGCSKDPTSPPEEEIPEAYTLQSTDTIGAGGGTVEAEGFSLIVPPGAFSEQTEMKLYVSDSEKPFGDNGVTKTYRIDGFPTAFSQPLRVAIKYEGTLSEESFVGFGRWAKSTPSSDSTIVYYPVSATDSSGYLVAELPVPAGNSAARPSGSQSSLAYADDELGQVFFGGGSDGGTHKTEHFIIKYPVYAVLFVDDLAAMLEESYTTIEDDLGFSGINTLLLWPLTVTVAEIEEEKPDAVEWAGFFYTSYHGQIVVNAAKLNSGDLPRLREKVGEAVLHTPLVHYTYLGSFPDEDYEWLENAVMVWSNEKFTENQGYQYPVEFPGHEMAPFNGMNAGTAKGVQEHGVGMSAMIKYLVDTSAAYGLTGLVGTYEAMGNPPPPPRPHPVAAILSNFNGLVAEWWPYFIRKYVGGEIYGVSSAVFTSSVSDSRTFDLNDAGDTLQVFDTEHGVDPYPDLSAKLFLVNLNYPTIDSAMQMVLKVSDNVGTEPVTLAVYGIQSGPLVYIGHTTSQSEYFQIPGLRMYMDEGWTKFLVVVINADHDASTYKGQTTDIDLTIKVEPAGFNRCTAYLNVLFSLHKVFETASGPTTSDYTENRGDLVFGSYAGGFFEDTYTGNVFYQSEHDGVITTLSGELTATLSPARDQMTALDFTYSIKHEYNTPGDLVYAVGEEVWTFSGGNIAKGYEAPGVLSYKVEGAATCNSMTTCTYSYDREYQDYQYWETVTVTTTGRECEPGNAKVEVRFWEQ